VIDARRFASRDVCHTRIVPLNRSCDCPGCPNLFTAKAAEEGLRRYRRQGPDRSTGELLDALVAEGIAGATLLDLGGGVGVIPLELLSRGAASAVSIDASGAYVAVARAEAERRGIADRSSYREADFVAVSSDIAPADVVTLDRMICCYGDMPALVGRALEHANRLVGLVYPRDAWWVRRVADVMNLGSALLRRQLRWHIHSEGALNRLVSDAGFQRNLLRRGILWQVAIFERSS
jgi:magnesium-protoporphyrin O-methyltransferase